jgi:hypothetical protein
VTPYGEPLRAVAISQGDVILRAQDARDLHDLLFRIFAPHVYTGDDATDYPGSVHGRTFPEWLALVTPS